MSAPLDSKDTGVTNGDVDWIFRGKIKKNNKGASETSEEEKQKIPKAPVIPSPNELTSIDPNNVLATSAAKAPGSDIAPERSPATSNIDDDFGEEVIKHQAKPKSRDPSATTSINSALNKVKPRSRSSSLSSTLTRKSMESIDGKRRTSVSSDNRSLATIPSNELQKTSSVTSGTSTTSNPLSSGSNLASVNAPSSAKKSLFSSISSKFSKKKTANPVSALPIETKQPSVLDQEPPKTAGSISTSTSSTNSPSVLNSSNSLSAPNSPIVKDQPEFGSVEARKRFGSLRGKVSAKISHNRTIQPPAPTERVILNKNPNKVEIPIEQLTNLKMKRVLFDINSIKYDPPQQIPSRKPKKGNVLIPDDIVAEVPRVSVGIANSDKKVPEGDKKEFNQKQYLLALESQKKALEEAKRHAQEAHLSALRIANEVANYKLSKNGHLLPTVANVEEEATPEQFHVSGIDIDKPMHHHEHHFADDKPEGIGNETEENVDDDEGDDIPLELLYTRCCHLREILPIPATFKQLKGKSKPLHVLKFLNPKPTLIDVLSFSDFIAIAPINTLIFDNVILTNEMIKTILTSLAITTTLEKLSLKNVMIDAEAWKFLCKFLLKNKSLIKLDLSQTKYRSDLSPEYYRFNMNWNLFVNVLKKRGGISELILTGIDFKFEDFKNLIENGMSLSTRRLGLASSNISPEKCEVINQWLNSQSCLLEGIDFGFNDLSQKQLSKLKINSSATSKLLFLSLNSTNLSDSKELSLFLKNLSELPNLSYLDLSSLPNVLPQLVPYLKRYLPKFPNLKRIHLDYNYLAPKSLGAILEILQNCHQLHHVSLIGNDVHTVSAQLYGLVRNSRSIFNLDVDYDSIPELISSKIAVMLMRNMEINLHGEESVKKSDNDAEDELIFDGSLIAETAEAFLNTKTSDYEDYSNRLIKKSLVNKTKVIRSEIHNTIDALFEKRNNGGLTIEGKERLLRFCLLDSALEKIVHIFENNDESSAHNNINNTPPRITRTDTINSVLTVASTEDDDYSEHILSPSITKNSFHQIDEREDEYMHNLSKDMINTNETISPELRQIQSSEIQYINPQQAQLPLLIPPEAPHQLALDKSTDGKEISVDTATGRPVLLRNVSQTSITAKRQEEEEGELHRWGFFVQQHRQLYPEEIPIPTPAASQPPIQTKAVTSNNTSSSSSSSAVHKSSNLKKVSLNSNSSSSVSSTGGSSPSNITPKLLTLITGEQLRKAVMKAKGVNSINELIDKVEHNSLHLDNIYKVPTEAPEQPQLTTINQSQVPTEISPAKDISVTQAVSKSNLAANSVATDGNDNDDVESIDSMANQVSDLTLEDEKEVDEAYEKLLNDVVRVRSNK